MTVIFKLCTLIILWSCGFPETYIPVLLWRTFPGASLFCFSREVFLLDDPSVMELINLPTPISPQQTDALSSLLAQVCASTTLAHMQGSRQLCILGELHMPLCVLFFLFGGFFIFLNLECSALVFLCLTKSQLLLKLHSGVNHCWSNLV